MALTYLSVSLSAAIWLYFIYRYDRFEPEPVRCVLIVGAIGGLLSAFGAGVLNAVFSTVTEADLLLGGDISVGIQLLKVAMFTLFVGLNEEIWKAFISILILRKLKQFNEPIDALIYSMSIALGFAAFENIGYTVSGGYGALILRHFTAVPLHAGLAAIWGSGISDAKYHHNGRYFRTVVPYVLFAALVHAVYNFIQYISSDNPVSLIVSLVLVFFVISYAAGRLRYYQKESPFRRPGFCPQCGASNSVFARYCTDCGSYIVTDYFQPCETCGARNRIGSGLCRHCGETI